MTSIGPTLPRPSETEKKRPRESSIHSEEELGSASSNTASKKTKLIGPTLPQQSSVEEPNKNEDEEADSSSEDDFGPSLPGVNTGVSYENNDNPGLLDETPKQILDKPQREAWMLAPPESGDWMTKVDPTKLRNRKFNSGKGTMSASEGSGMSTVWTETPEQKRERLSKEVMGTNTLPSKTGKSVGQSSSRLQGGETSMKTKQHTNKEPDMSLFEEHQKSNPKEQEDDPSQRAFDREKDIAGPSRIGHAKRKEMLNKAADFDSRFSKGQYL